MQRNTGGHIEVVTEVYVDRPVEVVKEVYVDRPV